ncbi:MULTISPECIES: DUF3278 domain-containing protein [Niallia]|jgi:cytochrome bd-type quinol oxidase subunit 2|uniref:DUF3278 domain-containing protein n=1 Tax=Niallia circulans TaxID=1397 RepID=A0AA91TPD4_NIACI|nr:DUF3278 domain-containing protein [Niallia circulans]AYV70468.1 DUF3278 domain-containing protein [Niallia circulans]NRG29104.1 DUF3278 domain-containing protein [Niallia circulans]PAD80986.1 hypothetical protein CHH57_22270 [Niallia circulans]QJX62569.1 DUF3278 domain-containing protein [Niallia circulans]UQZ77274.1 DUF3278 domain-containing protein [Niallia circulans]
MRSWISFLLPNDEYKEKRILYFFSEGAIILLLILAGMLILNNYVNLDAKTSLLLPIAIFLLYVLGRYILSGIEYADIATEDSYKKELRSIVMKTSSFVILFFLFYVIFLGLPANINEWMETIVLIVFAGLLWFFVNYISLKRSYNKNKDLL